MKTGKWIKKYVDMLGDISCVNRIVYAGYVICSVFYAICGYELFASDDFTGAEWQPVMFYVLLALPVLLAGADYFDDKYGLELRYSLYLPAMFFYGFMLLINTEYVYFLLGTYLIGMSVIYCDIRFSLFISAVILVMHIVTTVIAGSDGTIKTRIFQTSFMFVIAFFFNFSSAIIVAIRNGKLADVNEEKQRFQALMAMDGRWIFELDIQQDRLVITKKVDTNEEKQKIDNVSKEAKLQRFILHADWEALDLFIEQCRSGQPVIEAEMRVRNSKADYLWYQFKARTLYDKYGNPVSVIGTMANIDERKRMELRIADENMRDPLTKFYEREYTKKLVDDFLAKQNGMEYAGILLIDVDDFSVLTDKMGVTFADEVLKSMAADLDEIFYTSDILGHVGGDAFIICMKNIKRIPDIEKKMQEILNVVQKTYTETEMNFASTVTIGASVFPVDGLDYKTLYTNAEKALVYEKERGKNRYGMYDPTKEEEYNKLHIEEIHNKIKQKHEQELIYGRTESDSLIELAFKLIDESKDTDSAINLLLRQVTRQMGLDAICVHHRVGHENKVTSPYRCVIGEYLSEEALELLQAPQIWDMDLLRVKENDGFIVCDDTTAIPNADLRESCQRYGVRAYARCSYFEKEEYIGTIDFVSGSDARKWTKEDKQTMQAVTNVISSYLLKMKAYEDASETIERLTGYDAVTELYKYEKFLDLADRYLETAEHGKYVLTYLDFSNFKYINEMYGYEVGDKILKTCADRARNFEKRFIMGSRVFSDNLVFLLKADGWNEEQMMNAMKHGSKVFSDIVQSEYFESNVVCMIGLCPFVVDGSELMLKNIVSNANLARKEAKKPERGNCVIYDESMGRSLQREIEFANDMENAFRHREFVVYMQPKIDLKKHTIIGAEALIRWIKPDGTMILPNDFIPVFEKNRTVTLLDYYVYDEVCKYLANRIRMGERNVNISMNVSRVHLQTIDEMIYYIKSLLQRYDIKPECLEFELTETMSMESVDDTINMLNRLRELGVKVSMDDFGSGYSSLNTLMKLPLDVVKLDKEFLNDFNSNPDNNIIIPSIIDMAKKLKLEVVCEGVETKEQVEFLRNVDCDIVQGYYYSKPVPLDVFSGMLADEDFVINQESMSK